MKNVYDKVRFFYDDETAAWEQVVKREWVEGFLRQKAWQGSSDEELQEIWRNLEMFIQYLAFSDSDDLDDISAIEYSLAIKWFTGCIPGFKASLKPVRRFFNILIEFYRYLSGKKIISNMGEVERAAAEIAGGTKLQFYKPDSAGDLADNLAESLLEQAIRNPGSVLVEDLSHIINEAVERLMVKIGVYFQQECFKDDFERALSLYTGPMGCVPGEEQEDFWIGFWDYFLFDYHLLENDVKPLVSFASAHGKQLSADERQILDELVSAEYTAFYVDGILNHGWVECVDLFTEKRFRLPNPNFDYKKLRKTLFFSHVFSREVVMVNYVDSIEVSDNLRRRIKEEVIRQKAIFEIQKPGATWAEFFDRHAITVKHTVDVLVNLAKVNVTSFTQVERVFPEIVDTRTPDKEVVEIIGEVMPEYGFSYYDVILAKKMWSDFCQLVTVTIRKPDIWVAAIINAYSQVNFSHCISGGDIASDLDVSATSVYKGRARIYDVLKLEKYDPRYLSEEGFVLSLYTS